MMIIKVERLSDGPLQQISRTLSEAGIPAGALPLNLPGLLSEQEVKQLSVNLFSHHQDYADVSEEQRGSYLREYTALQEYMKLA